MVTPMKDKLQSGRYQCLLLAFAIIFIGVIAETFNLGKMPEWALTMALGTIGYYSRGGYGENK